MKNTLLVFTFLFLVVIPLRVEAGIIFSTDFDGTTFIESGVSGGFSGVTSTESVQGYSGLGNGGNVFGGNFLRNKTGGSPTGTSGFASILMLSNLPTHTSFDLNFLLAIIDSWDIQSHGDTFNVLVDGSSIFQENFTNNPDASLQGYSPPSGVQLTSRPVSQLGFNEGFEGRIGFDDSAWDMGQDAIFQNISHTGSTLIIEFFANGPGWSGGGDESFGLENVEVQLNGVVPEPVSIVIWSILSCIGLATRYRKLKQKRCVIHTSIELEKSNG